MKREAGASPAQPRYCKSEAAKAATWFSPRRHCSCEWEGGWTRTSQETCRKRSKATFAGEVSLSIPDIPAPIVHASVGVFLHPAVKLHNRTSMLW